MSGATPPVASPRGGLGPLLGFLAASCVGPNRDLWPPRADEPRFEIDVVFREGHTVLIERVADSPARFREWGYAEKAWYLEGKRGSSGAVRSLLWPTASVVGCRILETPAWRRSPPGEVERWTLVLSKRGSEAMRAFFEAEKGEALPEYPGWYAGTHAYHLFHTCHHFAGGALRAAGLPLAPWWCGTEGLLRLQLNRVRRFHEEEGLLPSPGAASRAAAARAAPPARRTPPRGCRGACAPPR
ncbi:MAG TPA: DUF2459 domain-containing protein [Planctomycetota bacterium]|nr:DUF2459 domain-containing protein [Planctomycetota bacterium]